MHCDLREQRPVFERLEHGPPQLGAQIDDAGRAVMETEPESVAVQDFYLGNFRDHELLQRLYLVQ